MLPYPFYKMKQPACPYCGRLMVRAEGPESWHRWFECSRHGVFSLGATVEPCGPKRKGVRWEMGSWGRPPKKREPKGSTGKLDESREILPLAAASV